MRRCARVLGREGSGEVGPGPEDDQDSQQQRHHEDDEGVDAPQRLAGMCNVEVWSMLFGHVGLHAVQGVNADGRGLVPEAGGTMTPMTSRRTTAKRKFRGRGTQLHFGSFEWCGGGDAPPDLRSAMLACRLRTSISMMQTERADRAIGPPSFSRRRIDFAVRSSL